MICPVGNCNNPESCSNYAMCLSQKSLHNSRTIRTERLVNRQKKEDNKTFVAAEYQGYMAETGQHLIKSGEANYRTDSVTSGLVSPGASIVSSLVNPAISAIPTV